MEEITIEGNTLRKKLENFPKYFMEGGLLKDKYKDATLDYTDPENVSELTGIFKELSEWFFHSGYISVNDLYEIYIFKVEFYFHCENDSDYKIKDPIVYHRNTPNKILPYFPTMTLHAHQVGFDITFESEILKYRASALIRGYEIFDVKNNKFCELKCQPKYKQNEKYIDDERPWSFSKISKKVEVEEKEKGYYSDKIQSLYDFLNGFSLDENNSGVRWVHTGSVKESDSVEDGEKRKNVYKYEKAENGDHKKIEKFLSQK